MNVIRSISILILFSLISSHSLAQLDSVWYQGPSVGHVTGGEMQNTDNFSVDISLTGGDNQINPPISGVEDEFGDMIHNWDESLLPEYVYMEDLNNSENQVGADDKTVLLSSFQGISMTNFIPPDPVIAAGPDHIIACVNSVFRIYDKEGNILKTIPADNWWAPAWPDERGDPQVIYDHYAERWVLVWMQVNNGAQTAGNLIAYSDDSNPLGDWYMYRLDTKMHGTVSSNTWGDYPKVGFDEEALYIMTAHYAFAGGYEYNKIRIIDKSELYSNNTGPLTYTDIWDIRKPGEGSGGPALNCIHPGISYTPGSGAWFYWAKGVYGGPPVSADFYAIYKITNPITSPGIRGKVLPVQTYTSPPLANQLGGGLGLETIGWITRAPVIRDGYLYASHDIQSTTDTNYSSIKYLKVDLSSVSISEQIEYGSIGYFYLFPALSIDQDHNIAITFSRSADTEYVGAYYTTKHANDPLGFIPSQPMVEGQGHYVVTYGGSINRWGDYFGIYLDPDNFLDVWMFTEYAEATNTWGTWISEIRMAPYNGPHAYAESFTVDFGNVEVGTAPVNVTVPFSNYGDADLTINSITSPVGPFTFLTNLSLPYPIPPYDSVDLKFEFDPANPAVYEELMVFDNNDPDFPGFTMKGRGFTINPAFTEYLYASTGAADTGKTVWLDRSTGSGTELGQSNFPIVRSLAIDPLTNIMYGIVNSGTESQIVRVNAYNGDAYTLYTLPFGTIAGIAFDNLGTCYVALLNGEIYTVDLSTGNYTLVTTTIQLTSITINPSDNQMWASPRVIVGTKDKIYKIDLTTGDATLIGQTGFGKLTNDLTFDESGVLYGVIGGTTEEGELLSISTSDGTGTLIGATGFTDVQGLAYTVTGGPPVSVDDDANTTVPTEFGLEQNYPNPFNPATTIKFSLPVNSDVKLVVYNMLGQEVATLLNAQRSAGTHSIVWNSSNANGIKLSSGIYFYELKANGVNGGSFIKIRKMVLLK